MVEKGSTVLYVEDTPVDERNRRRHKDTALGRLTYAYHDNGLLESITSSNSDGVALGYRYDEANRLAYVDDTSGGAPIRTTAYGYNGNGSLATVTLPNTVVHTYGYDTLNRLRTLNVAKGATSLHSYEYKLRASGHRHQVIENGARTSTFGYDSLYRLTSETLTGDSRGNNGSVSYGLDKVGNRESRTSSVPSVATTANTYNARDWLNTDAYDANGNTRTSTFSSVSVPDVYDFEDRLIIRHKADGSTVNLAYDADGILRQKTVFNISATLVSATGYMTDAQNPTGYAQVLEERINLSGGTTVKVYAYGSDLISQSTLAPGSSVPVLRYYAYDGLMSVRELTDVNGLVTDSSDYDAFGIRIFSAGSTVNDYLYRGERFDSDIGQYSLRARFYNQATGRFWNQDTYEGSASDPMSLHKYLYAHGNPVSNLDPSGNVTMAEIKIAMVIVGTINGMAVNSARNTLNQANGIFNPTGELNTALATLEQAMFVYEQINFAVAAGAGSIMAKRGLEMAWKVVAPRLSKALQSLSQFSPAKVFQAQLGRSRKAASVESQLEFDFTKELGGLVIGRNRDLSRPGQLRVGEYRLDWFFESLGDDVDANIGINIQKLQEVMRRGLPIRDASSALDTAGQFTNVERMVLQDAQWVYEWSPSAGGFWKPPS